MGRECAICNEDYDENERCPRNLPCSHTLCSQCIENLISRQMKKCPYCSRDFNACSVREIGINTDLLEVLKDFKEMEQKADSSHQMSASSSGLMEDVKKETQSITNELLVDCQKADTKINNILRSNNQLLDVFLKAEDVLCNTIFQNVNEMVTQNDIRITYLKEKSKRLERQIEVINEKRNQIMASKTKTGSAETFTEAAGIAGEVGCMKTYLQKTLECFMEQAPEEEKTHLELKKVAETTTESLVHLKEIMAKISPHQITIESLKSRAEPVLDLMRQGKCFAFLNIERSKRFALLSPDEENKIFLHCLREQIPPHDASILKHQDIRKLFSDSSSQKIFLNFGTDEESLGRIYISLKPNLKRSLNFWLLCTGEMGPSYLNSNISQVINKGYGNESIVCGDFDVIDGKALISGTGNEKLPRTWIERVVISMFFQQKLLAKGSVSGVYGEDNQAAKFIINMRDCHGDHDTIFGEVESNLHILEEAISQYENISEVKITDCGIMIPI